MSDVIGCDSCHKDRELHKFRLHDLGPEPWSRVLNLCSVCGQKVVKLMQLPRREAVDPYVVQDPAKLLPSQTLIDQGAVKPPKSRSRRAR